MRTVGIISCGATKSDRRSAVRDLYTSSTFQGAVAAAEATFDEVYVLSALHGLVPLDLELDPYDVKMGDPDSISDLALQFQAETLDLEAADVYGLLPASYFEVLDRALRESDVLVTPVYEGTRGVGDHRLVHRVLH